MATKPRGTIRASPQCVTIGYMSEDWCEPVRAVFDLVCDLPILPGTNNCVDLSSVTVSLVPRFDLLSPDSEN